MISAPCCCPSSRGGGGGARFNTSGAALINCANSATSFRRVHAGMLSFQRYVLSVMRPSLKRRMTSSFFAGPCCLPLMATNHSTSCFACARCGGCDGFDCAAFACGGEKVGCDDGAWIAGELCAADDPPAAAAGTATAPAVVASRTTMMLPHVLQRIFKTLPRTLSSPIE